MCLVLTYTRVAVKRAKIKAKIVEKAKIEYEKNLKRCKKQKYQNWKRDKWRPADIPISIARRRVIKQMTEEEKWLGMERGQIIRIDKNPEKIPYYLSKRELRELKDRGIKYLNVD